MVERLVGGLIRGSVVAWALIAGLWVLTVALVAFRRSASSTSTGAGWIFALLGATTATSIMALPLSAALSVPRLRWKTTASPDFMQRTGETWRKLRGHAVAVRGGDGLPDIGIPIVDASGQWVLFGLLAGKAVAGLPPALPSRLELGVPRICDIPGESCRPWPSSWPDPSRPMVLGESTWSREASADALAVDVEANLFLRELNPPEEASADEVAMLELVGRPTTDPPRDVTTSLFVIRRFAGGRLSAVRVVSVPSSGTFTFYLQRASVDLTLGRGVLRYVARPLLSATAFALPLGVLVYFLAPFWLALRRRRGGGPESSGRGPSSLAASRRTVSTWMGEPFGAIATLAAGLAVAAPAVVAIASLWASR